MDCEAIGHISICTSESPGPKDIAEHEGKLYVATNQHKICVYECNPNGEFIDQLRTSVVPFSNLMGMAFDSAGYLFQCVCKTGVGGIYAFTSNGESVSSFGLCLVNAPAGIAIDEDGFVYVCDYISEGIIYVF